MHGRIRNTGTTAFVLNGFHLSLQPLETKPKAQTKAAELEFANKVLLLRNKYNEYGLQDLQNAGSVTVDMLETEFKALAKLRANERLNEEDKLLLEEYEFYLMKATQDQLLKTSPSSVLEAEKPPKKPSLFRYLVFGTFLLLEFVPMIWGSYLGITGLMSTLPWLSPTAIAATGLLVCGIEAILYYAVKGPLLKRALGISTTPRAEPCLDIYEKQLQVLKNVDKLMLVDNKMESAQYAQYLRLANLLSEKIKSLKTYAIYVKTSFDDPGLNRIEGKALIVVGDQVRFITDKSLLKNEDGSYLTVSLTPEEKEKLTHYKRHAQTGKVLRIPENINFLDQWLAKTTSAAGLESKTKIKKFEESTFKKGLRWVLSAVDMSLNIGGGYFLATSLLSGTAAAAALLGTPIGWGIIALIIIGQFALRLAVGSNAMFNLLNPEAEKHKKVTEEINEYELNTQKYSEILSAKKRVENTQSELDKLQRRENAKKNPLVDSYKDSYLNTGLYKKRASLVFPNPELLCPEIKAALKC